jgi:uncharacterized membrane protein YphA (DoxX/SURF4 family)
MSKDFTTRIFSIIVGFILFISGFGKLMDMSSFEDLIISYGLGNLYFLAPLVVLAEIVLAVNLIFWIFPRFSAFVSMIMFIGLTIIYAYGNIFNDVTDCGCFGSVSSVNMSSLSVYIRNIVLIVLTFYLWKQIPSYKKVRNEKIWKVLILVLFIISTSFIAGLGFEYRSVSGDKQLLMYESDKEHNFHQKKINQTILSEYGNTSSDSTYVFYVFSYGCPHCWNSIENVKSYEKYGIVDRSILIATGTAQYKRNFYKYYKDLDIKETTPEKVGEITDKVPIAFFVKNNTITKIIHSEMPSGYFLRSFNNK